MQNISPPPQFSPEPAQPLSDVLGRVLGFAAPPLVPGENEGQYASLAALIVAGAGPGDAIEELLTRDVIDLTWDILRLRRMKAGILNASMHQGVQSVMHRLGYGDLEDSTKSWAAGEKRARKEVTRALAAAGLSMDEVTATTFELNLETFDRIERLLRTVRTIIESRLLVMRRNDLVGGDSGGWRTGVCRSHDRHRCDSAAMGNGRLEA